MLCRTSCTFLGRVTVPRLAASTPFVELLKDLRYRTDAPISDCSAALKEAKGDITMAMEILRKQGVAKAGKKGNRVTLHGFCVASVASPLGAAVITMCTETDFAARNDYFLRVSTRAKEELSKLITESNGNVLCDPESTTEQLRQQIKDDLTATIAVLGENVTLQSIHPLCLDLEDAPEGAVVTLGSYTHGTLGVPDVGRVVGIIGVYSPPVDANAAIAHDAVTTKATDDLARHFVANVGDDSAYQHQSFLGTEETVSKWLKRHGVKFAGSTVLEFGKEPVTRHPPKIPQGERKH